jgi:WD40 repeat protein
VDVVRGARARFVVLWVLLFALAGIAFGYVRWVLSPAPDDLLGIGIDAAAPRGSWIEIEGFARGRVDYRSSLFYDVASGRFVRARAGRDGAIAFSGDGTAAAWTERSSLDAGGPQDVWSCRFGAGEVRRVRTPISTRVWNIAMSPGGSRVALLEEKTVSVFEVPSGRLLASAATDSTKHYLRIVFLSEQKLRIYRMGPLGAIAAGDAASGLASIGIIDFEIDARRLKETASIENVRRPFSIGFNDRGERLIVWEKWGQVSLFDASTGRRLAPLGPGGWDQGSRAFLSDGRPIVSESAGGNGRVHLFSKDGQEERVFDVGRAGLVRLGGEPADGRITLAIGPAPEIWSASDAFLLDLNSGALRKLGSHLSPIAAHMRWRLPQPEPGSEATRLFSRADGSVVRLDPQAESLKTIFPKR